MAGKELKIGNVVHLNGRSTIAEDDMPLTVEAVKVNASGNTQEENSKERKEFFCYVRCVYISGGQFRRIILHQDTVSVEAIPPKNNE